MIKSLISITIILAFGVFVLYNRKVLKILGDSRQFSEGAFYNILGKRIKRWNVQMERATSIKKGSMTYKVNNFFKEIITNLDMAKDDVTPIGLLVFISSISASFGVLFLLWTGEVVLTLPAFAAIFYLVVVVFRFMSLMAFERKEAEIMDTEDLIAMDIKGGVYNAILRYRKSLHPNMRPYFEEFIDNIQNKGYSFESAMILLNEKLGRTFTDFAQKAVMYEKKADNNMEDIFSSVVELNRYRRELRYENNKKFNQLRLEFLVSIILIAFYGVFSIFSDPFLAHFFQETLTGKLLILVNIVVIAGVLAYIASIKAKFL